MQLMKNVCRQTDFAITEIKKRRDEKREGKREVGRMEEIMQYLKGALGLVEAARVLINSNFTTFQSSVCFLPSSTSSYLRCTFSSHS